jgi:hypothetical protein
MKNFFLILGIILISKNISAQIGGISGSKISAVCVDVVDNKKVEFEPSISYSTSKYFWDNNRTLKTIYNSTDSVNHITGMNFRVTYGLWDKLEFGGSISTELLVSDLGLRYVIVQNKKIGFAAITGAKIPLGNKPFNNSKKTTQNTTSAGLGFVISVQFNENLSLDFNAQGQTFFKETVEKHKGSYYLNADAGYYLFAHQLQLITGFGYQYSKFENFSNSLLTIYPGLTLETGKNYILVLSCPFDIYGKNTNKSLGINLALTLTFE